MNFYKKIKVFFKNFKDDDCLNHAASIAYFSVLSALPLVFLISSIIGFFTGSDAKVMKKVYNLISPQMPNLSYEMWLKLTGLFSKTSYSLNLFSLVLLFISGTFIFNAIDKSLQDIFKDITKGRRFAFQSFLMYAGSIVFLTFLVFSLVATDILFVFLNRLTKQESYIFLKPLMKYGKFLLTGMPFLLQIATIMFMYHLFLPLKLTFKKLFTVSLFIVIMWFIAIRGFSWYVNVVPTYNIIYGSMSIFIIFITWSYYSALIFLIGAEILKLTIKDNI